MNKLFKLLTGVMLVGVLVGCKAPPHFSPNGRSIAYSNGHGLFLRSHGHVTRVDEERPDVIAWSPDDRFLAWTTSDSSKKPGHQSTLSIADAVTKKPIRRELDAEGIAWLNGRLLCTTSGTGELITLEPHGLKTIAKRRAPASGRKIYASSRLREAYLETTGNHVFVYDGTKFLSEACPVQSCPMETSGGDVVFVQLSLNGGRTASVWRKSRSGFVRTLTVDVAPQFGPRETVVVGVVRVSISDDGRTLAALSITYDGTLAQRQQLIQIAGPLDFFSFKHRRPDEPNQQQSQIDELIGNMKQGAGVLVYKRGHLKQWIPLSKEDDDITLDPSGRRLAIETDSGIRMVNLKP